VPESRRTLLITGECLAISHRDPARGAAPQASGAPAIAAWVAARLGTPTTFVGGVGNDEAGELIRSTLAAGGIRPESVLTKAGLATATAYVEYFPDGSRVFEFHVAGTAATALVPADLADLPEHARWVHVSGSAVLFGDTLADTVIEAVRRGRDGGATVSVDPNMRAELDDPVQRAKLRELCLQADVLFPSEDELAQLDLDADDLVARGVVVCQTMAEAGARIRHGELDLFVPAVALPDEVLDPDGAGDTFAGAVIAARLRGADWAAATFAAARVVARAIAVPGPMTVALTSDDLSISAD
jgi:sugar/nucleoside kinase (ribokinase family)